MSTLPMSPDEFDDESEADPSALLESEQQYGRYRLCFELASGGMGKVFLARAEGAAGFEKLVALKRIHPHLAKKRAFVDMFLDEARIASKISHPNVCSVFDFGEHDGTYYIAMEYLVGEPLSRVMNALKRDDEGGGRSRWLYGARIVADACEGLHAAHELKNRKGKPLNVVHRDVSPHNLFVTYDGSVRIVDFGIARAADQVHETTTGSVKGKWTYMSPEQARGRKLDRRTDIWALGVIMWELATNKRLFWRTTQTETVLAVTGDDIPRPRSVEPAVPEELDRIVMKALSRDVDARYRTTREMGKELLRFLGAEGVHIGLPDLAEWMEGLFPASHAKKTQLLTIAHQAGTGIPTIHHTPSEVDEASGVREGRPSEHPTRALRGGGRDDDHGDTISDGSAPVQIIGETQAASAVEPLPSAVAREPREPSQTESVVLPTRGRGVWAVAFAAILLVGGVGTWALTGGLGTDADTPEAAATEPETPGLEDELPTGIDPAAVAPIEQPGLGGDTPPEAEGETEPELEETPSDPPEMTDEERREAERQERQERLRDERRRREQQVTGTGTVDVAVIGGWGIAFHNGQRLREVPGRLTLPAGRQVLEIRPMGRTPGIRRVVNVRPDGRHSVTIRIE